MRAATLVVGSHGQLQSIGYNWEMWALASGGMSNMKVLRAATIQGARVLGLAQDLGSIEPGKLADIYNTNSVKYVMKNGEIFEAATLNEVWPEKKPSRRCGGGMTSRKRQCRSGGPRISIATADSQKATNDGTGSSSKRAV